MNFRLILFISLMLIACESRVPNENNLLDHSFKYTMFDFFSHDFDLIYDGTNFTGDITIRQPKDSLIFEMDEHNFPLGINVSQHNIRFETQDPIELPNLIDLGIELSYTFENTSEQHQGHDIEGILVYYKIDDEGEDWTFINKDNMKDLIGEVRPMWFRAEIHVYSGLPEFSRDRSYENTAIMKVTSFRLFGKK